MSAAKRRANRLNAQKSTGPKTAEGKAASSRNAISHGIFCQDLVLPDEDPDVLEAFKADVVARLRPRDAVEAEIVEHYLHNAWRLKRLRKAEHEMYLQRTARQFQNLQATHGPDVEKYIDELPTASGVMREMLVYSERTVEKLSRYEQRMFNAMLRCTRELRILQREEIEQEMEEEMSVQNEATEQSEVSAQNEATDTLEQAKSSDDQGLELTVEQAPDPAITPEAEALMAQMAKMLDESVALRRQSAMLGG